MHKHQVILNTIFDSTFRPRSNVHCSMSCSLSDRPDVRSLDYAIFKGDKSCFVKMGGIDIHGSRLSVFTA